MTATRRGGEAATADRVRGVATAVSSGDTVVLRRMRAEVARARTMSDGNAERAFYDGLLGVVDAALDLVAKPGLAPQAALLEPGSLAARMLLEISGGVRGANGDLADRLNTDQWQISRAGRRLRELNLATRVREGRLNGWRLTRQGEREVVALRRGMPAR